MTSEKQYSLVLRWCGWCNRQLLRGAALLQQKTSGWPALRLRLLLVLFCLVFTGASIYTVVGSLQKKDAFFRVTPIQVTTLQEVTMPSPMITKEEYHRIHRLRMRLDSLRGSVEGKWAYDSLLQKHPHLLDTLTLLEHLYSEQNKN